MRCWMLSYVALSVVMAVGSAAASDTPGEVKLPFASKARTCTDLFDKAGDVPQIHRGQQLGIACSAAGREGSEVRVVMQFDPMPGETPTGYGAFLITEQTVEDGLVHVRVPDMPDVANHTVDVKVFVTDEAGTASCDAGRIKIV